MTPQSRNVRTLLSVACVVAIVLTVVAGAVGLVLVGRAHRSLDDSLGVTIQAIDAVEESITVSRQVADSIATAVDAAASIITTVQSTMDTTAGTLDTIHTSLTGSLTDSIVSIKDVLPGIKDGARAIDTALTDLSKLPIGPDYKPAVLFADSIQGLSDAVGALPADIDTLATKVDELQGSTTALNLDLTQLSTTVSKMHDNIAAVQDALDKYVPAAADARLVASRARSNLDNDTALARLLIIAIALALVLSEVVLLWIARHLTNGTVRSEPISNEAAGAPGPRPPSHPEA